MKRKDLEVGKAYWYARTREWEEYLNQGSKIIVVDDGCWEQPRHHWSRDGAPRKVTKGTGVLVDMTVPSYSGGEDRVVRQVVSLATIRGEYEETRKQVEENEERRRVEYHTEREARDKRSTEIKTAVNLARENGVVVGHGGEISISAAELTRLVNAAKGSL